MRNQTKNIFSLLCLGMLVASTGAHALSLEEAKSKGVVGESADGYLGAVSSSAEVDALVKDVNEKRRAEYKRIAESNKLDPAAVEKLAGSKAIEKTPAGQFIKAGGSWQKK